MTFRSTYRRLAATALAGAATVALTSASIASADPVKVTPQTGSFVPTRAPMNMDTPDTPGGGGGDMFSMFNDAVAAVRKQIDDAIAAQQQAVAAKQAKERCQVMVACAGLSMELVSDGTGDSGDGKPQGLIAEPAITDTGTGETADAATTGDTGNTAETDDVAPTDDGGDGGNTGDSGDE
ncbi:MAG TPA: hypothetical protein VGJ32_10420 [Solirubrobacteraceae bacterium]|jgi:hypothetical protein